jgi:hypothetical protein
LFRTLKYNYTISTTPEPSPSISPTNSNVFDIDFVVKDAIEDLNSSTSSTVMSENTLRKRFRNLNAIDGDHLQVKSAYNKNLLARDLNGSLNPADRRHSLYYSHKRIKSIIIHKSMKKIKLGTL